MGLNHIKAVLDAKMEWPGPSGKLLAVVMAYAADRRGIIRLTHQELAEEAGLTRRRIIDLVDDLCALGVIVRLKHGRYGLKYGFEQQGDEIPDLPQPKGQDAEVKRLWAIIEDEKTKAGKQLHCIAFRRDGWPVIEKL